MSFAVDAAPLSDAGRPVGGVLTPRMERLIRVGSVGSALVIAISAMVLSYAGLHDLALDAKVHPRLALLVPVMVDGLQFVGSLGVVYSTLSGLRSWYPWCLMLMGVSISAWGNWQAAPDDLTAKLLHAAAPVILALVLEELLRVMRHKVQRHAKASGDQLVAPQPQAVTRSAARPSEPESKPEVDLKADESRSDAEAPPEPVVEPVVEPGAEQVADAEPVASVDRAATEEGTETEGDEEPGAREVATEGQPDRDPSRDMDDGEELPPYPQGAPFKDQVRHILVRNPNMPAAKIARVMGKDPSYTRKIVRDVRAALDEEAAAAAMNPSQGLSRHPSSAPASGTGERASEAQPAALRPTETSTSPSRPADPSANRPQPSSVEAGGTHTFEDADPFAVASTLR